jgi:hypothetical protein
MFDSQAPDTIEGLALVQIHSIGFQPVYVDPSLLNIKPISN